VATLPEIMLALADQIAFALTGGTTSPGTAAPGLADLAVNPMLVWNPTPPALDVYPADPFQESIAYGRGNSDMNFVIRARVNTPDVEGAQELLLSLMEPVGVTSVAAAVNADRTLGGVVETTLVTGPSDYGFFVDPGGGALLGCTWKATVTP
jgi:hypothetical protein